MTAIIAAVLLVVGFGGLLGGCARMAAEKPRPRKEWALVHDFENHPERCRIIERDGGFAIGGFMDEVESAAPEIVREHNKAISRSSANH